MSFVLLLVGILATATGVALIGFGIPINEFSLGNTLILAGTTALTGGLVIITLSRALSQLARIADALSGRRLPPAGMSGGADPYEPTLPAGGRPAASRAPLPPRARADMPPPGPRGQDPRMQSAEFEMPEEVEPVRPPPPPRVSEPPLVEEADDLPLSPRPPARPSAAQPAPEGTPSGWRPPRPSPELSARKPAIPEPRRPQKGAQDNPFDSVWPSDASGVPQHPGQGRREPVLDSESAPHAGRPEPVTVLKSGVVDGMAYTLYTDGSIEAELAQGVVRFGSIEELRNHLEKSA